MLLEKELLENTQYQSSIAKISSPPNRCAEFIREVDGDII